MKSLVEYQHKQFLQSGQDGSIARMSQVIDAGSKPVLRGRAVKEIKMMRFARSVGYAALAIAGILASNAGWAQEKDCAAAAGQDRRAVRGRR